MDFQKDLAKIKAGLAKRTSTEEGYRGLVSLVLFLVGYFGVIGQLSTRLVEARELHVKTTKTATLVADIRHFEVQSQIYASRMTPPDDTAEWGQYILDLLQESKSNMVSFAPHKVNPVGNYRILKFEVTATGEYYQLVDFMDRLEKGERFVRIDEFEIQDAQGTLQLRSIILCLAGQTYEQMRSDQNEQGFDDGQSSQDGDGEMGGDPQEPPADVEPPFSGDIS